MEEKMTQEKNIASKFLCGFINLIVDVFARAGIVLLYFLMCTWMCVLMVTEIPDKFWSVLLWVLTSPIVFIGYVCLCQYIYGGVNISMGEASPNDEKRYYIHKSGNYLYVRELQADASAVMFFYAIVKTITTLISPIFFLIGFVKLIFSKNYRDEHSDLSETKDFFLCIFEDIKNRFRFDRECVFSEKRNALGEKEFNENFDEDEFLKFKNFIVLCGIILSILICSISQAVYQVTPMRNLYKEIDMAVNKEKYQDRDSLTFEVLSKTTETDYIFSGETIYYTYFTFKLSNDGLSDINEFNVLITFYDNDEFIGEWKTHCNTPISAKGTAESTWLYEGQNSTYQKLYETPYEDLKITISIISIWNIIPYEDSPTIVIKEAGGS